ncbi:HET-domain-containing protein [Stipitochalara longipes BDJ]|nr:HET-domain-containing protein [Stipitochalara longipes BDJ]
MGKRKQDEDPKSITEELLRGDVKKRAFDKCMIEAEVDEVLTYEQLVKDEAVSKELMIAERWAKLDQWAIRENWMMWEEELSINHLSMIRDELMMEEEFEKDRILMEEAFTKGEIPTWGHRDAMNYLLGYLSEMETIKDWHWQRRDEALDAMEYGEEYYEEWLKHQNLLTDEERMMNEQRRMEEAMIREQDVKSIKEKKVEKLLMMQEELIMDEVLIMDDLLTTNEESMSSQQDTIDEESIDYEQVIKDEMLVGQVGWYLMDSMKDEQSTIFNYTPLDQPKHETRVVRLHPAPRRRESPIICDLIAVDLRSAHSYEALSYEWGSPSSKKHTIRLNGSLFSVRENLWRALYNLRDSREPRTFWIDALCINQASVHERNCQVSRMGDIYSQAARVVAWIGEDDHEARKGRAFLSELTLCSVEIYCPPNGSCLRWQHSSKWAALSSLCTRSYWSRLWIIQEVLLASDLVIQCGQLFFQWQEVSNVFHYLRENSTGFCSPEAKHSIVSSVPFRLEYWRKEHRMAVFKGTKNDLVPLHYLVALFKDSLCFDTRDKVFGLRSLSLACCKDFVRPDYSVAYEEVARILMVHHDAAHAGPVNEHPFSNYLILLSKI